MRIDLDEFMTWELDTNDSIALREAAVGICERLEALTAAVESLVELKTCPACEGTGDRGDKACWKCEGSGVR